MKREHADCVVHCMLSSEIGTDSTESVLPENVTKARRADCFGGRVAVREVFFGCGLPRLRSPLSLILFLSTSWSFFGENVSPISVRLSATLDRVRVNVFALVQPAVKPPATETAIRCGGLSIIFEEDVFPGGVVVIICATSVCE